MLQTCLGIFFARIFDVSLGTLRTVYTVKGKQYVAATIAFIEVFIWFMVAREALSTTVDSLWIPISYSLGYATGTMIGTTISNKFVSGIVSVQVITHKDNKELINTIREKGYGLSICALKNDYDEVKKEMLIIQANKKSLKELTKIIRSKDAGAFLAVNDTKVVHNGYIK